VRLTDLSPRWLSPDVFTFLCPHCCHALLTCKRVSMGHRAQSELWKDQFDWDHEYQHVEWGSVDVILCDKECAWTMSSDDFETMTVAPSIDASQSGHWHGHIVAGEIKGGVQCP